ncbi:MAG: universal stress protein [Chloroflexi bacterium]|nr:universal stress protein [Chloroflexota bacterium]
MKRYLVPLDGSPLAEQALPHAMKRAQGLQGSLVLVRVVNMSKKVLASAAATSEMEEPSQGDSLEAMVQLGTIEATTYFRKRANICDEKGFGWNGRCDMGCQQKRSSLVHRNGP